MNDLRRYLTIAAAFLGVLLLVTVAFAAAGTNVASEHQNEKASQAPEDTQGDAGRTAEAKIPEGGGEDSHGQCVSAAAHHEADGLDGWRKGLFVSSVAQDEGMLRADCDFSSHLDAALLAPDKGGSSPQTAQAEAHAADQSDEAGEANGGGKDFGQGKRAENAPDAE